MRKVFMLLVVLGPLLAFSPGLTVAKRNSLRDYGTLASRVTMEFDRKWIRVHEQRIALPHGGEIDEFHLVEGPDWASVLAVTEAGEVVFVQQYRHGARSSSLELPAGAVPVSRKT